MNDRTGVATPRLFATCFTALVATSFGFVLRAMTIDDWGHEFALTETQKGELLGVGLWPFAISIALFSLVIDRIGFRRSLWFAFACHVASGVLTATATGYWSLYIGTFVVALGNGAVEAAVNPAIAAAHADDKTRWLNRLHAGWPAGLVLGGAFALLLGSAVDWRTKIMLIQLPTLAYGALLLKQRFPVSERVAAGVPWRAMLQEVGVLGALVFVALMVAEVSRVFDWSLATSVLVGVLLVGAFGAVARSAGRPLFLALLLLMMPLATTELGTDSWITDLLAPQMQALGFASGWILVWTSLLMMVLRLYAGPFVHRLGAPGLLAASAAVAAVGLVLLSNASGLAIIAAATVYGLGKAFLWPTMLGITAERFPRGGALTLNVVAAVGMLSVGVVGASFLGRAQDVATTQAVAAYDGANATQLGERYLGEPRRSVLGDYRALDPTRVDAAPPAERGILDRVRAEAKQSALAKVAVLPLLLSVAAAGLWLALRGRSDGGEAARGAGSAA